LRILAFRIAKIAQTGAKHGAERLRVLEVEDTNAESFCLLGARRKRPCGRRAEQRDELPPLDIPSLIQLETPVVCYPLYRVETLDTARR